MGFTIAEDLAALREGDRFTSKEFLRRWEAMPELKHAELIEQDATPGCEGGSEGTWIMGPDNVPQPDAFLRILPQFGGQSAETGGYGSGAPELIVEVSGSTLSRDLGTKLDLYRRSGVREYLTILRQPRQIIWRGLSRGRYREMTPGSDGLLRSRVFPGLWLDPDAVWNAKKSLRKAVEQGIQSAEHAAFVRSLAAARKRK
jgi:hypothetical protein